ncbi:hypothetical protein [Sneathiella limimaris]|uniref:hypothetical protein n=1 Tax=Sneathiella limimaris TaxID=1964213 RepID=UPI00146E04D2|nr:hypothetical protein [Sneathiella limimaris]
MDIELHYLLGGATTAVLILILLIRLIAGQRDLVLTEDVVYEFLRLNEPDETISKITLGRDHKSALAQIKNTTEFFALRSFGNKLVHQRFAGTDNLAISEQTIRIQREDISHAPLAIQPETEEDLNFWIKLASEGKPNATA